MNSFVLRKNTKKTHLRKVYYLSSLLNAVFLLLTPIYGQVAQVYDEVSGTYYPYATQTLDQISDYTENSENLKFSRYGGWENGGTYEATGFFRTEKVNGRWWIIDPDGYLYIHKAVNSVQLQPDVQASAVHGLLHSFGMNGLGNWSDQEMADAPEQEESLFAYCPKFSFAATYKRLHRDDGLKIPVFDEEFVEFCQINAERYLAPYKDDPNVLGYFIDNELSWTFTGGLESHLNVSNPEDLNYQKAIEFLEARGKQPDSFDGDDEDAYAVLMIERYLNVVCSAIRAVDPNHMILGPRFNKSWMRIKEFYESVGKYLDIVAVNHYHRWGSRSNELQKIAEWSQRPLLVSEFYAMEKRPDMTEVGAGWIVKDQVSRALFYQHFITTQLTQNFMVGFHWFRYLDDENGAKGIVGLDGITPYTELRDSMKYMNDRMYDYIASVDSRPAPAYTIVADSDATYRRDVNLGTTDTLLAKKRNAAWTRHFSVRFDTSDIPAYTDLTRAKIQLFATSPEEKLTGHYFAALAMSDEWEEEEILIPTQPEISEPIYQWNHGDDIEIDVTEAVIEALASDNTLSLIIYATVDNDMTLEYASREHADSYAQPKLVIYSEPSIISYSHIISSDNFENGFGSWSNTGSDSILYTSGTYAIQGDNAALLRDDTSQSRLFAEFDLSLYDDITVDFSYLTRNFASGHDFFFQISTDGGETFEIVKQWFYEDDFLNNEQYDESFTISNGDFTAQTILRFKCDADSNTEEVYLDTIKISGTRTSERKRAYSEWKQRYDIDLDSSDDPDEDTLSLPIEYIIGGTPDEIDHDKRPAMEIRDGQCITSFQRNSSSLSDFSQVMQYSTDLENWFDISLNNPTDARVNIHTLDSETQQIEVIFDTSSDTTETKFFTRLLVEEL